MSRVKIPKIEFYITNVCNLTCSNCNRYNDFNFKGWQRWSDYADDYAQWAKYVDFEHIVILGGEPLLNPTIIEWIDGINLLWPQAFVQVLTNGVHLNKVNGLYDRLVKTLNWVGVSLHNENETGDIFAQVEQFLTKPLTVTHGKETNGMGADHLYTDVNGVQVALWNQTEFSQSSLTRNAQGQLTLHDSDPLIAHGDCGFVHWKNYHLIKGKMYKCGPVALLPEFDQQYPLAISDQDRALLNSYRPLTPAELPTRLSEFLAHIDDPLEQCKFCPEQHDYKKIWAIRKGSANR
jgi:organic radical activating enzyme